MHDHQSDHNFNGFLAPKAIPWPETAATALRLQVGIKAEAHKELRASHDDREPGRPGWPPRGLVALTAMFTDMAGSSTFAEKHGSKAAYEKWKEHNRLLLPMVEANSGTVVNTIGDALLVIFEQCSAAARCAIAMQRRLAEYNATEPELEDQEIHVRIGLHHGKAMVFRERSRLAVVGRAINVASRVEQGGGRTTDQILASEAALAQLGPGYPAERLPAVRAKGVGYLHLHRLLWEEIRDR